MAAVKKVGQKNGEVGLLVEYLFCAPGDEYAAVATGKHQMRIRCAVSKPVKEHFFLVVTRYIHSKWKAFAGLL